MSPPPAPEIQSLIQAAAAANASPAPPPALPRRRRRKNRAPVAARLVVDELRGETGYVSADIWRDVFGFWKESGGGVGKEGGVVVGVDDGEEPEEEPIPPTLHAALAPLASEPTSRLWTIFPVTIMPESSQFPRLPPCTVLLPSAIKLPPSLASAGDKGGKPLGIHVVDVVPVGLETVIVSVRGEQEDDQDLEDRVKEALGKLKIVHMGDEVALNYGHHGLVGRKAKIQLCEPVRQGLLLAETKVVVVKERVKKRFSKDGGALVDGVILDGEGEEEGSSDEGSAGDALDGEDEEDDDEEGGALEFSTFLTAPPSASLSFHSMSSTPYRRNGSRSPNASAAPSPSIGKLFRAQPLTQAIPPNLLHPKPKEQEDGEARVFVKVSDLARLGCFSGDWVRISPKPPVEDNLEFPSSPALKTAAEIAARSRGPLASAAGRTAAASAANGIIRGKPAGSRETGASASGEEKPEAVARPVRVYSLPEGWEASPSSPRKRRRGKGKQIAGEIKKDVDRVVYLSPILLANLSPSSAEVVISPLPSTGPSPSLFNKDSTPVFPPSAKEVTLLRIASPTSTDRALQPSLLLQLKSYFESCRRLVKKGDLIAVGIDEVLARSLYGDTGEDGITEELLTGNTDAGKRNCVAWFRVGSIVSSIAEDSSNSSEKSPVGRRGGRGDSQDEDAWSGVVFVDPASTRMVQAGSEKRKIPPTLTSTWEYYLGLLPPPHRQALGENRPPALVAPTKQVNQTHRRLRELVTAATSLRAIALGLQPIAILLTSTQRAIGKRTLAMRAAADVGVHVFHIDAYDIISDGGAGDVKTEAFLRARVDRASSCGRETCVLLLSHIEAFTGGKMGEVLKDIVSQMRIVIATTTEVDKLSEGVRNVFTHEMEVAAPDEKERVGLLEGIVDEKKVRIGGDVELAGVAVKTAALVAGDLVDVVERAVAASHDRVTKLAKRCRQKQKTLGGENNDGTVEVRDLELAGGDEAESVLKGDFEVAVEAARRNFADSIGAPKIPNVGWDDVGGLSNVKSAVMETIQLPLERPELFAKGMKKRSGILFYGPPGTGKTLLAKAIATEFSLNFFSIKGPELLNMYIGESEANVRRVFQRARDARPCVVFFDELDSVAPKRGNQGDSGGVMDRIVSQLLAELDGMSEGAEGSGGVFVIGATNRPDLLDAALLRPGRFDKMLYLGVSDTHDKQLTILEALTRKFTLSPTLSLRRISETLPFTYTGADLYALCSDAMLKAITRQASLVDEKIKNIHPGPPPTTAYFFDHLATQEDVLVVVTEEDFLSAKGELVGSVSAKELEHYQKVREQFEMAEDESNKKNPSANANANKNKNKGKTNTTLTSSSSSLSSSSTTTSSPSPSSPSSSEAREKEEEQEEDPPHHHHHTTTQNQNQKTLLIDLSSTPAEGSGSGSGSSATDTAAAAAAARDWGDLSTVQEDDDEEGIYGVGAGA